MLLIMVSREQREIQANPEVAPEVESLIIWVKENEALKNVVEDHDYDILWDFDDLQDALGYLYTLTILAEKNPEEIFQHFSLTPDA